MDCLNFKENFIKSMLKSRLTCHARFMGILLARHMDNETGECNPLVLTVSNEAGISDTSAKRALRELQDKGYVEIDRNSDHGNYRNNYKLNIVS